MNTFLLIVSFVLHAVSFLIIILLYYRLEQTREIERKQGNLLKDMEDVLSSYIMEMKEENELFLKKVKHDYKPMNTKPSTEKETTKKEKLASISINTIEPQLSDEDLLSLLPKFDEDLKTFDSSKGSKQEKEEKEFELLPLGQQAKKLHNKGLSVEEIAKQLNKGVTEIELFLKFN
ncbi:hypothetical protein JOC85_000102 [Bacillus mesophilus]|uniref:Swarming motility protein SwrB n=1 Tax=Bacillus mesophilus TaxID=1808955 RepID=A0A6M0Q1R0_9BACI|nr:hypothetical protein [Bacillus mesophilus]MBM7659335.1 hypothetical protein [Bacillus mesophilus]NEY70207.1 hypothetical protein [Bacillus mesophilus]